MISMMTIFLFFKQNLFNLRSIKMIFRVTQMMKVHITTARSEHRNTLNQKLPNENKCK